MLRIVLSVLFCVFAVVAVAISPACTVTSVGDCEDDSDCDDDETCDDGECVNEGGEGEGEGEGDVQPGNEDTEEQCADGGDNDGDGFVDCDDFTCQDFDICNLPEDNCSDGQDNNGNTFVDCADFSCDLDPACAEDCANGVDDDGDNRIDCGDGGCAGDPACDAGTVEIQTIQSGEVGEGAVASVDNVYVTQLFINDTNGNVSLFLQEPQGETIDGHPYPHFAGISLFVGGEFVDDPGLEGLADGVAVGDCVSVTGEVDERNGGTQLFFITRFVNGTGCGAVPEHSIALLEDIATDTDPDTEEDQPGPEAEAFEGTLVTVENVTVVSAPDQNGNFNVAATGGDQTVTLLISDFLLGQEIAVQVGDQFSSISGIYNQFFGYALQPVEQGDLVP
jgi:hypothetical protein